MKGNIIKLVKKPAIISTLAFFVLLTVVTIAAFAGKTPTEEAPADDILVQSPLKSGYGLYIDGQLIAATSVEAVIEDTLDYVLETRVKGFSDSVVTSGAFTNVISVVPGEYEEDAFVTSASLAVLLGVESEDSFTTAIRSYNSVISKNTLNLRVTVEEAVETVLESDIVYVDNSNLLATHDDIVLVEGQDGLSCDTYETVYINGECISKKFLSSTVVVESVDRVIERGVLDNERVYADAEGTTVDDSTFIMPYDGAFISSYYGWRSMGWHSGIDIIGGLGVSCYGDPFWAAKEGVVTFADYSGTYGLVIIIDHGDGSETRYAHCSASKVEVGEYVEQGQVIGNIGDTGYVTGAHLHFEIRIDGNTVNPLKYVRLYKE